MMKIPTGYTWIFLLLTVFTVVSCKKKAKTKEKNGYAITNDVSYGSDAKQKMDIHLPDDRSESTTKTFIVIHGGGWVGGDKNDMAMYVDSLKKRFPDWAFANMNYRLASGGVKNLFPTQENDVKAAIDFYLGKSAEYKVSKKIIVYGLSAGGHLALLHGYKNDPAKNVVAIIDGFGPADMVQAWNENYYGNWQPGLIQIMGKSYPDDTTIYIQSSPVNYITPQSPPTIALQGGADALVNPTQTYGLITKLQAKGVVNQLVFYQYEGHGWTDANLTDTFNKIQTFIATYVP